ncbi:bestrophin-like domain [Xanthobacter versatilis]|uniref:bestrophin-like domain n=1 Tax=Xanthobacter autotrophicus (strain ATCC BAA-1158 / Py2) TaxID=78245 RepID=UPI00372C1AB8
MSSILASLLALFAICGSAVIGLWLAPKLPEHHLTGETGTAVSVSMAVVGTLAALVLGLMVNSASSSYSARTTAIEALAADIIKLNRVLLGYGAETAGIRDGLAAYARAKANEISKPASTTDEVGVTTLHELEALNDEVLRLEPKTDRERHIQARAISILENMVDARWTLVEKSKMVMPAPFFVMLVAWLSLLFASFGLFAPRNATVMAFLLLGASAIAGCVFIILELGAPSQGLIRPSADPLYQVVRELQITIVRPVHGPA